MRWEIQLELQLRRDIDIRVLTTAGICERAGELGGTPAGIKTWIRESIEAQRLLQVRPGLFLNHINRLQVNHAEAIPYLFPGGVLSLQRTLGEYGVLHNPSSIMTVVSPCTSGETSPQVGQLDTPAGTFRNYSVPRHVLEAGDELDRLLGGRTYPMATPEKALVDWVYLSSGGRDTMTPPPAWDIEFEGYLDEERLERLATAVGVQAEMEDLRHRSVLAQEEKWNLPPLFPS